MPLFLGVALLVNSKTWDYIRGPESNFIEEAARVGNITQGVQEPEVQEPINQDIPIIHPSPSWAEDSKLSTEDDLTRPSPPVRTYLHSR